MEVSENQGALIQNDNSRLLLQDTQEMDPQSIETAI